MRLVVFDMDGTLIDTHGVITQTMRDAFVAEDLAAPHAEEVRQIIGLSLPEALSRLSGVKGAALEALVARYRSVYIDQVGREEAQELLYEGAREAVLALAAEPETLLGIATGKALRGVERVLNLHGLTEQFVTRQTPDHNPSKPHPGMLFRAMGETGAARQETVMIGDTSFDMEMARAAGVRAIGVSWGYHEVVDLRRAGAHLVIDEYAALPAAIETVLGPDYA